MRFPFIAISGNLTTIIWQKSRMQLGCFGEITFGSDLMVYSFNPIASPPDMHLHLVILQQ